MGEALFDVERFNKRKNEVTVWKQMTQAGRYTRMSDLGHIVSFSDIEPGKLFEVSPYILGGMDKTAGQSTDGQGAVGSFDFFFERSHNIELTDIFNANQYGFSVQTNSSQPISVEFNGQAGDFFNFPRQAVGCSSSPTCRTSNFSDQGSNHLV